MTQSLVIRLIGGVIGSTFVASCFNSRRHLGFFDWEIDVQTINAAIALSSVVLVLAWQFATAHDKCILDYVEMNCCNQVHYTTISTNPQWVYNIGQSHCKRASSLIRKIHQELYTEKFTRFALFQLIVPVLTWMTSPANDMMQRYWMHVQQMQEQLTGICVLVLFIVGISALQGTRIWHNWECLTIVMTCMGAIGSLTVTMIAASGVCRNQYFYQFNDFFVQLPRGCNYLVATIIIAELSPKNMEASVYGIVTGAHSIAPVVARAIANPIYAYLPFMVSEGQLPKGALSRADLYVQDSPQFSQVVQLSLFISVTCVLVSASFTWLLPVKSQDHSLPNIPDPRNRWRCACVTAWWSGLVLGGVIATVFAIVPRTSCHALVGGGGC